MRKRKWMPERGSQRVLFVIVAITAVVFAAYYLFGFNHPYADDPDFNEPRLTNVLLGLMAAVGIFAIATLVWAIVVAVRRRKQQDQVVNRVPVALISSVVVAATVGILVIAFLIGSSQGVEVNGKQVGAHSVKGPDWKTPQTLKVDIDLQQGDNVIRLWNDGVWLPDIDKMDLD